MSFIFALIFKAFGFETCHETLSWSMLLFHIHEIDHYWCCSCCIVALWGISGCQKSRPPSTLFIIGLMSSARYWRHGTFIIYWFRGEVSYFDGEVEIIASLLLIIMASASGFRRWLFICRFSYVVAPSLLSMAIMISDNITGNVVASFRLRWHQITLSRRFRSSRHYFIMARHDKWLYWRWFDAFFSWRRIIATFYIMKAFSIS